MLACMTAHRRWTTGVTGVCHAQSVGFFDRYLAEPSPAPAGSKAPLPVWVRPEAVLPAVVAANLVLARTGDVAVAIPVIRVYPSGFGFHLAVRLRVADESGRLMWAFEGLFGAPRGGPSDEAFRLAVEYPDGRVATKPGPHGLPPEPDRELVLSHEGGGGGGRTWNVDYWVHPLPPPGPLAFSCEWPGGAVPVSRVEIDAQQLLDASTRAIPLWPETEGDGS